MNWKPVIYGLLAGLIVISIYAAYVMITYRPEMVLPMCGEPINMSTFTFNLTGG